MTGKEKEVKENRIQELLVKREEYLNSGEIEKEIEVLRELRVGKVIDEGGKYYFGDLW